MTWWDFLSDFILIMNDLLTIHLFDVYDVAGVSISVNVGGLLTSVAVVAVIIFFLLPRR